ncbi:hypothetical protein DFH06DRAFT_1408540 [Mycena polygramma]|nr:hypothetical protein DFH06DRAFT_1408540 [Mycena polygramma]
MGTKAMVWGCAMETPTTRPGSLEGRDLLETVALVPTTCRVCIFPHSSFLQMSFHVESAVSWLSRSRLYNLGRWNSQPYHGKSPAGLLDTVDRDPERLAFFEGATVSGTNSLQLLCARKDSDTRVTPLNCIFNGSMTRRRVRLGTFIRDPANGEILVGSFKHTIKLGIQLRRESNSCRQKKTVNKHGKGRGKYKPVLRRRSFDQKKSAPLFLVFLQVHWCSSYANQGPPRASCQKHITTIQFG